MISLSLVWFVPYSLRSILAQTKPSLKKHVTENVMCFRNIYLEIEYFMKDYPVRANFFDASALAKVFTKEHGPQYVNEYFNKHSSTEFTTQFCLYETLNVLKSKWIHGGKLSKEEYLDSSFKLVAWYQAISKHVRDLDFTDPFVFNKTKDLADRYSLDLSDAFQILTVKEGEFSFFASDSKTLLVTADRKLADASLSEGIKTWYCMESEIPE